MKIPATRLYCAMLAVAACLSAPSGLAGSLGVGPTLVELDARRAVRTVHVRNTGSEPAVVQVDTVAWSQDGDGDVYSPTSDIAATPAVFELAPGAEREVRVGWRGGAQPHEERAYRIYVSEVVPERNLGAQLNFAVRIGIPVFARSTAPAASTSGLSWQLLEDGNGCQRLRLRNASANRHRVTQLELLGTDDVMWDHTGPLYVLAGATRLVGEPICGDGIANARRLRVRNETRAMELPPAAR